MNLTFQLSNKHIRRGRVAVMMLATFLTLESSDVIHAQAGSQPSTLPEIRYHLTARPWAPLNTPREAYLDYAEGIARYMTQFQNSSGAVIDPYGHLEVQYSTPYLASTIATLVNNGRASDILENGAKAMDKATLDFSKGINSIPQRHGEFYVASLTRAFTQFKGHIPDSRYETWRTRLKNNIQNVILGSTHNWRTYAMKGEWFRIKAGLVDEASSRSWLESSWIDTQRSRMATTAWNMYRDKTSDPDTTIYEAAARGNLLHMLLNGYDGPSTAEMHNFLFRAGQTTLLTQDPTGQNSSVGRSGNHVWNDIVLGNSFEVLAEMNLREGKNDLAGQYRHAAMLGLKSATRWKNPAGFVYVTKNHFDPSLRTLYATYSYFANYNGYNMFHSSESYSTRSSVIVEQPVPSEIGGFVINTDPAYSMAVANAGGMQVEMCLRGATTNSSGRYWNPLGIARFSRVNWESRLGPSDGVRDINSGLGVSFAPTFLEGTNWVRLASVPDRYQGTISTQFTHPLLVRCTIDYKPKSGKTGPTFKNSLIVTPDGVLSTITSSNAVFGVTLPLLENDGQPLSTQITNHIASVKYPTGTDQENFIALHSSPTFSTKDAVVRSAYGDLRPVRMTSGQSQNTVFIYPRNGTDPLAESVRTSFVRNGDSFKSVLGRVEGNMYVGRTSAGGFGNSLDLNSDGSMDVTFNQDCNFVLQLNSGKVVAVESDRVVNGTIQGTTVNLEAYKPVKIPSTKVWSNIPFDKQTGKVTLEFDAIPQAARMDGVVGTCSTSASTYASLVAYVRFNNNGFIDARNGGGFTGSTIAYDAGKKYRVRLAVNIPAHTYNAYVKPEGGTEVAIGQNLAFRDTQSNANSLSWLSSYSQAGSIEVSNIRINPE